MNAYFPKRGYLFVVNIFNMPIYFHWTFPAVGLFIAFFLGDVSWITGISLTVAYTSLILIHELGHALAAIYFSHKVRVILITGAGGWCFADEPQTTLSKFLFYSGGILAQLIFLIAVLFLLYVFGEPSSLMLSCFVFIYTIINVILIIINIIPSKNTDGLALLNLMLNR